jgi:hypothetical protein
LGETVANGLSISSNVSTRVAVAILEDYAAAKDEASNACPYDAGPVVLAHLVHFEGALPDGLGRQVALRWLNEQPSRIRALGAFGGLGGLLVGMRALVAFDPDFAPLLGLMGDKIRHILAGVEWRFSSVVWADYDIFRGPAGLILAGATELEWAESIIPAAHHLTVLCDVPTLERLRAGTEIDQHSAINIGRINTGMGHGVAGVASALRHAVEAYEDGSNYRPALRRACDWLAEEAFLADRDFITWPPVGRDGARASGVADRRQAWCYGTPGVAWTLWDAGRVLGDASLQVLGEEAMRSFCRVFDADFSFHIHDTSEELAICHGAAGTLSVADAFARYAALREAAELRDYLDAYLLDRVDQIADIARTDMTMLSGAGGIVSVMLTVHGGARNWLCQIALR